MTTTLPAADPSAARAQFRAGLTVPSSGWAPGYTQANLVVLPRDWAYDMLLFGQRNPQPVPLLDVTDAGSHRTVLAPDADLRTDLPRYRVWRDGECVDEPTDVTDLWGPDLVAFLIGCSFSFETALLDAGVPVRNIEQGRNVSMYRTDRECRPAGRLSGPLVVSMRPVPGSLVATAVQVTGRMPQVHGAPVHVGAPAGLGIADLARPDFGDPVELADGDVPVFWACGVTPQAALMASRPPFAITHAPGHMFVTDVPDAVYRQP
ncbi:putative hydro-lyase [Modestobacter muralis]|uniref:Putative hydro-lyase G3R41_02560 n=1 Tax=Modestobacter muralis TaxID=1608614 RepID=A0A6P0ERH4_9ACTN|nr:putative hydro-lyase [Modestobacter muralis]NEK93059.1 putative hydro-lyase [Modestobacter muralis]NEN49826.1 putative hydro-lyase [Modestobacter muralis]